MNSSGSGTTSGVIQGIEHVAANCAGGQRCVANMSLGGAVSDALDEAVASAVDTGVTFVVAAGNSNTNACNSSPAREPKAITVGSTTRTDSRSSFSNYGNCVNVFAPGSSIKAAWIGSNSATNTISGTSMASPREFQLLFVFPLSFADLIFLIKYLAFSYFFYDRRCWHCCWYSW